jgi:hypothetical protein
VSYSKILDTEYYSDIKFAFDQPSKDSVIKRVPILPLSKLRNYTSPGMSEICYDEPIRKMINAIPVLGGITEVERNTKVIVPTVSLL